MNKTSLDKIIERAQKARDLSDKAHREICDLASGKRKWEMCVPVQTTDSDMVLQAPLDEMKFLTETVISLAKALKEECSCADDEGVIVVCDCCKSLEKAAEGL